MQQTKLSTNIAITVPALGRWEGKKNSGDRTCQPLDTAVHAVLPLLKHSGSNELTAHAQIKGAWLCNLNIIQIVMN